MKHSFRDPLINPPKNKGKTGKGAKAVKEGKPNIMLTNNILERRESKVSKPFASAELKLTMEEENEGKM